MTQILNTWSTPEVAKAWPEGSQIVWRVPLLKPTNLINHYGHGEWSRDLWVGKLPSFEFMLLELPL